MMRRQKKRKQKVIFSLNLFIVFFLVLLLVSGIHIGLIVLSNQKGWSDLIQIIIPMAYWAFVAFSLCAYTFWRVHKAYAKPMDMMEEAAAKVSHGDFSVYIPPRNTPDKDDYINKMFVDFNKMVEELGSVETLKTDFFSNVSHEIKTPLAVIQSNAELLNSPTISEEKRKECTQNILSATNRLSSLIIVNIQGKKDYELFSSYEKKILENTILLVALLFKLCKVKLVIKADTKDGINKINYEKIAEAKQEAATILANPQFVI